MKTSPVQVRFMGQEFTSKEALAKEFPAFAGEDAWRTLKAGCTTVMEVEQFCYQRRRRGRSPGCEAIHRAHQIVLTTKDPIPKKRRRRKAA